MDEQLDQLFRAGEKQIELAHRSLNLHLDESDRIHARNASQTIVNAAALAMTNANPTQATP